MRTSNIRVYLNELVSLCMPAQVAMCMRGLVCDVCKHIRMYIHHHVSVCMRAYVYVYITCVRTCT